ncbi:carboxylesterase family protein [Lentzea sp. BCCO 10_0856]|uniref:Carboxylesterase family protein n=1 Tax=Lentzea miocenica TaxID=3095431 RepID=A0ABU4T3K0_9PSEU|nr:carboxylesterase family protein [Lentzea sp. BCCO 10_0856]MDX8032746.1 carboxylesterase family protein [Lentzea sp. BCCO 10_0856]
MLINTRGVRYAKAARFAEPEPVSWDGVVGSSQRGPACPQPPSSLVAVVGNSVEGLSFDEHCQVLSVTAPADASGLPVMVWFHGGAYVTGSGESKKYDATLLATEGVVVVSVSYRLGIFGYLRDDLGLLDQLVALRWVRDNIAAFGGDPSNVTAFGQSAGADSVYALMLTDTENLFHRAILQSAPLGARGPERAEMTAALREFVSVDASTRVDDVLAVQQEVPAMAARFGLAGGMPFGPVIDEVDLSAAAPRVELLVGHTADDGSPYVADHPEAWATVTELVFAEPARRFAADWTAAGGQAATYNFKGKPPGAPLGACHCMELPYLFDPDAWASAGMLAGQEPDPELAKVMRRTWTEFARNGIDALPSRALEFGE